MPDNVLLSRNGVKSFQVRFFCFKGKSCQFDLINK